MAAAAASAAVQPQCKLASFGSASTAAGLGSSSCRSSSSSLGRIFGRSFKPGLPAMRGGPAAPAQRVPRGWGDRENSSRLSLGCHQFVRAAHVDDAPFEDLELPLPADSPRPFYAPLPHPLLRP